MNKLTIVLNDFMNKMKRENPNANWSNLVTGFAILVILTIFSVWYFGQNTSGLKNKTGIEEQQVSEQGDNNTPTEAGSTKTQLNPGFQEVTVQSSEGLWQVAERICGDGEKYNKIADQNDLTVWSTLSDGQTLKVNCNE